MASTRPLKPQQISVTGFYVEVQSGPCAGASCAPDEDGVLRVGRGTQPARDGWLKLPDPSVSEAHLDVRGEVVGLHIRDHSSNGSWVGPVSLRQSECRVNASVDLRVGETDLRVVVGTRPKSVASTSATRFGSLVGTSLAMRRVFARASRLAETDVTVLITGENGTGKTTLARAIHERSPRSKHPFLTLDCTTLVNTLLVSQLFGHRKGAYVGAVEDRPGIFEEARGGTVFLDELGELSLGAQAALLRVIDERKVQRLGEEGRDRSVDVRVIAGTHRELAREVNLKQFRLDLYMRLAVTSVEMPALRNRIDELDGLVAELIARLRKSREVPVPEEFVIPPEVREELARRRWVGNVRELHNYLRAFLIFGEPPAEFTLIPGAAGASIPVDDLLGMLSEDSKRELLRRFDRVYIPHIIKACGGVVRAAEERRVDRATLWRRMRDCGLRERDSDPAAPPEE